MNGTDLAIIIGDTLAQPDSYGWRAEGSLHVSWLDHPETKAFFEQPKLMPVLYRMTDTAGDLLYVGISNRPLRRWHEHKYSKPWWPSVDEIAFESISWNRQRLLLAERQAIAADSPRHNGGRS